MGNRLVQFQDTDLTKREKAAGKGRLLIDPDAVNAIVVRQTYTTLSVGGHWYHVEGTHEEVLEKLGKMVAE